jgi:hypothetical protein
MPRRPLYGGRGRPWLQRIGAMFTDPRTWSTQLYFLLMLPLGIVYFTLVVSLLSLSLALVATPFLMLVGHGDAITLDGVGIDLIGAPWSGPLAGIVGVLLLFASLHLVRLIGGWHGLLAKHLLVKSAG